MIYEARVLSRPAVSVLERGDVHLEVVLPSVPEAFVPQRSLELRLSCEEASKLADALMRATPPAHYWAPQSWAERIEALEARLAELERA